MKPNNLFWMLTLGLFLGSCSSLKKQEDPYASAWMQVQESQDWERALVDAGPEREATKEVYYALPDTDKLSYTAISPAFLEKYRSLVSRAYFRLIADALESNYRVTEAYKEAFKARQEIYQRNPKRTERDYELAKKRYLAHSAMLEGLRSWRAFHEDGSDDLDFFLAENLKRAQRMYEREAPDEAIVEVLMKRLADLYHKSEAAE